MAVVQTQDLTKSFIPFLTTVSLVAFVAWGTFIVTKAQIQTEQRLVRTAELVAELTDAVATMAEVGNLKAREQWTWIDMTRWCLEQKAKYPDMVCPVITHSRASKMLEHSQDTEDLSRKFKQLEQKAKKTVEGMGDEK